MDAELKKKLRDLDESMYRCLRMMDVSLLVNSQEKYQQHLKLLKDKLQLIEQALLQRKDP